MILAHAMLYILPTFPAVMLAVVYAAEHPRPAYGDLRLRAGRLERYDRGWRRVPAKPAPSWDLSLTAED